MKVKDIKYVFQENPELRKIGTETQYSKYLKTIFPNSEIKNIVYHHSYEKIEKFKNNFKEGYAARHGVSEKAIFFLEEFAKEEFLSKRNHLNSVLINLENPLKYNGKFKTGTEEAKAHSGIKEGVSAAIKNKNDGVIFGKIWDNKIWSKVLVVFSSRQTRVLGSKKDKEEFKKFVKE